MSDTNTGRSSILRAIATDLHFWIPLSVLLGGLVLLDRIH
jgi:hypothetical protein